MSAFVPPCLVKVRLRADLRGTVIDLPSSPLYLPEQRALVFADAVTAPEATLRVWTALWMTERTMPDLRSLLELPFEQGR